jgi:hypothetical protein
MSSWAKPRYRKAQIVFACLAVFALLFMVTESTLTHHHAGSSDATCPVCHIAHHAPIQTATVVKLPVFMPVAHGVRCEVRTPVIELYVDDHSSRAPPSA